MASADRPDRAPPHVPTESGTPQPDKPAPVPSELLEQVVAETIAAGASGVTAQERAALLEVARRHRGQPLDHDQVVPDLVLTILQLRLDRLTLDADQWRNMAAAVAATLLDAPDVRQRLQVFWDRLGRALP